MNALTITKQALRDAMAHWEEQARAGKLLSPAEAKALPLQQVADESTDFLWKLLERDRSPNQPIQVLCSQEDLQRALHLFLVRIRQLSPGEDGVMKDGMSADELAGNLVGSLWLMLLAVGVKS